MRAFFFGCARGVWGHTQAGHGFHTPGGARPGSFNAIGPWKAVDAQLAPVDYYGRLVFKADGREGERGEEYPQGVAALHNKDGWTALAFWDRTGDSRGNSNSNFFFDADLDFVGAVAAARAHFPELFERFNFEVVEVGQ